MRQLSISYEGLKTGIPEFDDLLFCRYVSQETGCAVRDMPVMTDGISRCSVLILKNVTTNACLFIHLGPESIDHFSSDNKFLVEMFLSEPGDKVGVMIENHLSYSRETIIQSLIKSDVRFLETIRIDAGELHSAVSFRPLSNEILCLNRAAKTVTVYAADALASRMSPSYASEAETAFADKIDELQKLQKKFQLLKLECNSSYWFKPTIDAKITLLEDFRDIPVMKLGGKTCSMVVSIFEYVNRTVHLMMLEDFDVEQGIKLAKLLIFFIENYADVVDLIEYISSFTYLLGRFEHIMQGEAPGSDEAAGFLFEQGSKLVRDYPALTYNTERHLQKIRKLLEEGHAVEATRPGMG